MKKLICAAVVALVVNMVYSLPTIAVETFSGENKEIVIPVEFSTAVGEFVAEMNRLYGAQNRIIKVVDFALLGTAIAGLPETKGYIESLREENLLVEYNFKQAEDILKEVIRLIISDEDLNRNIMDAMSAELNLEKLVKGEEELTPELMGLAPYFETAVGNLGLDISPLAAAEDVRFYYFITEAIRELDNNKYKM